REHRRPVPRPGVPDREARRGADDLQGGARLAPARSRPRGAEQGADPEVTRFDYHEPTSLAEAVDLSARFGGLPRPLAGGTALIVQIQHGRVAPRHVIALRRVPGLDGVEVAERVTLGAAVTHRTIERTPGFAGPLAGLVEGAQVIGGHQVRNVGTV